MVTPAVVLSYTCSYCPANRDTSVEVPPISKPMTGSSVSFCHVVMAYLIITKRENWFCLFDSVRYPTTPPAGPDNTALAPLKWLIGVKPPSLCMKSTLHPSKLLLNPLEKPRTYFLMWGVRYESAQAVKPLGTIRTMGITSCDKETCSKPNRQNIN